MRVDIFIFYQEPKHEKRIVIKCCGNDCGRGGGGGFGFILIAPLNAKMQEQPHAKKTERLIMLLAAPRNALTGKTATTVLVLPLHQAVHTSIQPKAALLSVSIPVIIHVSETEQLIINLAGQVIAWVMKYVNMAFAKRRL